MMESSVLVMSVVVLAGYLLGSVPFSYLVARASGISDVRSVGSGNVGASNVMRNAGVLAGVAAFVLDVAKGAVAALVVRQLWVGEPLAPLAATAAVIGHVYPVWLGFRGGKGVATGAGAFAPLAPAAVAVALAAFAATVAASRYISLGSMFAAVTLPVAAFLLGANSWVTGSAAVVAVLVVVGHRDNIGRIARGVESRLGEPRP